MQRDPEYYKALDKLFPIDAATWQNVEEYEPADFVPMQNVPIKTIEMFRKSFVFSESFIRPEDAFNDFNHGKVPWLYGSESTLLIQQVRLAIS